MCSHRGISVGRAGTAWVQRHTANGLGVVRNYCGHGIGEIFHTELQIPHFDDPSATTVLEEGMISPSSPCSPRAAGA